MEPHSSLEIGVELQVSPLFAWMTMREIIPKEGEGSSCDSLRFFGHPFRPRSMFHPYNKEAA
jgi:hypothetical protein